MTPNEENCKRTICKGGYGWKGSSVTQGSQEGMWIRNSRQQAGGKTALDQSLSTDLSLIPLIPESFYRRSPACLFPGETGKLLDSEIPGAKEDMREDQSLKTRRVSESQHGKWWSPPCPWTLVISLLWPTPTAPTAPRSKLQSLSLD